MSQISIVIPTLNEAGNIEQLLTRTLKAVENMFCCGQAQENNHDLPMAVTPKNENSRDAVHSRDFQINTEIIIVDDDSQDNTREIIEQYTCCDPRIRLIHRCEEKGLSSAVVTGAKAAKGRVVVVMDADLSHPPESIPELVQPILAREKQMVIGSRYIPGGSIHGWPAPRALASKLATVPAGIFTDVKDPLSGFFAVDRKTILALDKNVKGFKIGLELIVKGGPFMEVLEVPIRFEERHHGKSKISPAVAMAYISQLTGLAGGNISKNTGLKFCITGLLGFIIDSTLFHLLYYSGFSLGSANTVSFFFTVGFNYFVNACWTFAGKKERQRPSPGSCFGFAGIALLALFLRGGVLTLLTRSWHWPVATALTASIGAAAVVNYLGCAFMVFSHKNGTVSSDIKWRIIALCTAGYSVILRLVYLGLPELMHQEAYYWNYGQHPALGYLDHPPLLAWLIRGSTELFGNTR